MSKPHTMSYDPAETRAKIELAEKLLPVPDLFTRLGYEPIKRGSRSWEAWVPWREVPGRSKRPSLAIFCRGGKWWWKDMARPKEAGGSLTFLARVRGMPPKRVVGEFLRMAGVISEAEYQASQARQERRRDPTPPRPPVVVQPPVVKPVKPVPPKMRVPTLAELATIQRHRGVRLEALVHLVRCGWLRTGHLYDHPCWWLTDRAGWLFQARRLDNEPWPEYEGEFNGERVRLAAAKSRNKARSAGHYPLGLTDVNRPGVEVVAVVEGGPDVLAMQDLVLAAGYQDQVAIVGMLGATQSFRSPQASMFGVEERLRGKRVLLFPHHDGPGGAGQEAERHWRDDLTDLGCQVHTVRLDLVCRAIGVEPVKDVNDLLRHRKRFEPWRLFGHFVARPANARTAAEHPPEHHPQRGDQYQLTLTGMLTVPAARSSPRVWTFRGVPPHDLQLQLVLDPGRLDASSVHELRAVKQSWDGGRPVYLAVPADEAEPAHARLQSEAGQTDLVLGRPVADLPLYPVTQARAGQIGTVGR